MKHDLPSVDLYVPAYNAADTIGSCLRALRRQTLRPQNVVVVDDGSADETAAVAKRCGARVIRHRGNRGVAAARNTAIRAVTGDLIASLDADLVAPPDWLERLVANFRSRRKIAGCCGQVFERYTGTIADRWRATHMKLSFGGRRSYHPRWLYCGISLIRRDAIIDAGWFDERCLSAYEDVDLSLRLRQRGHTLLYDPQVTAEHLKRSTPADVVRGFWSYWAGKNEMEGAYGSLSAATDLMVRRQMGIAAYRLDQDFKHNRHEFLPLDLLIPLTFCLRDLEKMRRLKTLSPNAERSLTARLIDACASICAAHLPCRPPRRWAQLSRGNRLTDDHSGSSRANGVTRAYVQQFELQFDNLLRGLTHRNRQQISDRIQEMIRRA